MSSECAVSPIGNNKSHVVAYIYLEEVLMTFSNNGIWKSATSGGKFDEREFVKRDK